jgi:hypothetical protein
MPRGGCGQFAASVWTCLDWLLIVNRRHLHRVLTAYLRHYNTARPHRGINLEGNWSGTPTMV